MISNISCLIKAAKRLGIKFYIFQEAGNLVKIVKSKDYYFVNCKTPLNTEDIAFIALDKEFTFRILKDRVNIPDTISFFDPNVQLKYIHYVKEKSIDEMVEKVVSRFGEEVIIKRNSGRRGNNVYECKNKRQIKESFENIFNHNSKNYDFLALAQRKINIKEEFRVIIYKKNIRLVYTKWVFKKLDDLELQKRLQSFLNPIFDVFDLQYGGLDIALDIDDQLWLIEINTAPRFEPFIKRNGENDVIIMYEEILRDLP